MYKVFITLFFVHLTIRDERTNAWTQLTDCLKQCRGWMLWLDKKLLWTCKLSVCMIFLVDFIRKWFLWNKRSRHSISGQFFKRTPSRLWTRQPWGNESSKEITNITLIILNPYRWERKTVPVQVLLSADPPFIKGFSMGFPSGLLVWTDWYAPMQRTWGPLWIWLQLETVTPLAGCKTSSTEWKVRKMWWQKLTEANTRVPCFTSQRTAQHR